MKNHVTELVFILDKSGSMQGLEMDTIGGFNAMIEKQRAVEGKCYVSTVLFHNNSQVLHDRIELAQVPKMTEKDYVVGGCTALLDAVGDAIRHIGNVHKYARPEDVPEHTMFIITTDGMENASHRHSAAQIKKLIENQKEKYDWEFIFLAANIDAVETAESYGISRDRAVNYHSDSKGTRTSYAALSEAITSVRRNKSLSCEWKEAIEEDYENRKK